MRVEFTFLVMEYHHLRSVFRHAIYIRMQVSYAVMIMKLIVADIKKLNRDTVNWITFE
ncbi:hypothetical protein GGGNBK_15270 [Sporosarcina sp. ANT_H38]